MLLGTSPLQATRFSNLQSGLPTNHWYGCGGQVMLAAVALGRLEWLLVLPLLVCAALALLIGRWTHRALTRRAVRRLLQQAAEPVAGRARFSRVR